MREGAHLTAAMDRMGRFSGYYKCSPNPKFPQETLIIFAAHARYSHPGSETR